MSNKDWSKFNESAVREEIIAPWLRRLGYQTDTENHIVREQYLRYNKSYLGHKKPQKDWPLIGKADYTCEAKKRVRWTIEAKSPDKKISIDDVEQAYTYARHPEVRAVYFCICNGRELRIYNTANAPTAHPILVLPFKDFVVSHAVENLLSPDSVVRDHPNVVLDFGKPIAPGLRSTAHIMSGHIVFQKINPPLPTMNGFTIFVRGGVVQRNDSELIAFLDTVSPYESMQKLNERLGLAKLEITSVDFEVSDDENQPTSFESDQTVVFAKGEEMYNITQGKNIFLPMNLTCKVKTLAEGVLKKSVFSGKFQAHYDFLGLIPKIKMDGIFELQVS